MSSTETMGATMAYEGVLSNGVKYQIHQSSGFSNKCDIAINIAGEFIAISTIIPKRNGNIEVIPMSIGRFVIDVPDKDAIKKEKTISLKEDDNECDLLSDIIPIPVKPKLITED